MENEKIYKRARAIKKGNFSLAPPYQLLVDWLNKQLNAPVLDFYLNRLQRHDGTKHQCVTVIMEKINDAKTANTSQNINALSAKFNDFLHSKDAYAGMKDFTKNDFYEAVTVPYPDFLVGFCSLEDYELRIAIDKLKEEIHRTPKFKDLIWKINNYTNYERVIFYFTDAQKKEGYESGATAALVNELFSLLKKYDEFNYFEENPLDVRIDTKETFDRDYGGQEYIYFR